MLLNKGTSLLKLLSLLNNLWLFDPKSLKMKNILLDRFGSCWQKFLNCNLQMLSWIANHLKIPIFSLNYQTKKIVKTHKKFRYGFNFVGYFQKWNEVDSLDLIGTLNFHCQNLSLLNPNNQQGHRCTVHHKYSSTYFNLTEIEEPFCLKFTQKAQTKK